MVIEPSTRSHWAELKSHAQYSSVSLMFWEDAVTLTSMWVRLEAQICSKTVNRHCTELLAVALAPMEKSLASIASTSS
jgi:hypothetical protein